MNSRQMPLPSQGETILSHENVSFGKARELLVGDSLDCWSVTAANKRNAPAVRVPERYSVALTDHPWAYLSGALSRSVDTEADQHYQLSYWLHNPEHLGGQANTHAMCDVLVNGEVIQTVHAPTDTAYFPYRTYFTAAGSSTEISLNAVGDEPLAIGNVTMLNVFSHVEYHGSLLFQAE